MDSATTRSLSVDQYFELCSTADGRFEFFRGEAFAMAGGTDRHNEVALNVATTLRAALRGKQCKVFMADVRLEVEPKGHYTYPDVFVTCDPRDLDDPITKRHASLVVEIVSKETESYDRGLKAHQYRKMPSLQAYLVIDPARETVELQTRLADGSWSLRSFDSLAATAALPPHDVNLRLAEVFSSQQ